MLCHRMLLHALAVFHCVMWLPVSGLPTFEGWKSRSCSQVHHTYAANSLQHIATYVCQVNLCLQLHRCNCPSLLATEMIEESLRHRSVSIRSQSECPTLSECTEAGLAFTTLVSLQLGPESGSFQVLKHKQLPMAVKARPHSSTEIWNTISKVDVSLLDLAVSQLQSMDKFKARVFLYILSLAQTWSSSIHHWLAKQAPRDKMICILNACRVVWAFLWPKVKCWIRAA